jgi:restriction endonuclease S subunit
LEYGASLPKEKRVEGPYPVVGSNGITGYHNEYLVEGPTIVVGRKGSAGEVTLIEKNCFPIDTTYYVKQTNPAESNTSFLYWLLKTLNLPELRGGAGIPGLNRTEVYETHQIPLPPLEVQKEIVAEIEGYQKVINGARAVLDNYRPHIPIHPDWPLGVLADVCTLISGQHIDQADYNTEQVGVDYLTGPSDFGFKHPVATRWTSKPKVFAEKGDILMTVKGSGLGSVNLLNTERAAISRQLMAIRVRDADTEFIYVLLMAKFDHIQSLGGGAAIPGITREHVLGLKIPLPPLATQQAIVAEIEAEQALVAANRELITRFEQKIQTTLARIWGEEVPAAD